MFKKILEGTRLPCKAYILVGPLMMMIIVYICMVVINEAVVPGFEVAVIKKDQESKNKLVDMAYEVYYYFWPKPTEELKAVTYFQRLWNYVMH